MAERVVLHVGAMKSGTSYLQSVLFHNKASLARQGVLVPGDKWNDQVVGVRQVLSSKGKHTAPRWKALVDEIRASSGIAVISMEFLGPAQLSAAERVVDSLGVRDVRVVVTARDLNRSLTSMWQETIQNGRSWTWADYVGDARAKAPGHEDGVSDRTTPGGTFWRQQHIARMTRDWATVVGREQCTLLTVPPPGSPPELLAARFGEAAGLVIEEPRVPEGGNQSLGLASILALRRLNELLDERGLEFPLGQGLRKRKLAKQILASRRRDEPTLGLPVTGWVREQSAATLEALERDRTPLVGDWSDLVPVDVPGVDPADVPDAEVAEAALFGLAGILADQIKP